MKKMIPALACLLLTSIQASAQSESQSMNWESLRGLKGVAVSVMVNRGDAMDEAQRLAASKVLQAEAEARFQKAGIPLLKYAQEVEEAPGSPRFLHTITLNKADGHARPVATESKLVQNVRLSRDPSVEISVTTWASWGVGGGYEVTDVEKLREQIGYEVDHFIRAYLKANPTAEKKRQETSNSSTNLPPR